MTNPTPLTEEQMAQAKAELNAAKVAFVQEVIDALDANRALINGFDTELFFGGLPQPLMQVRSMLEGQRNEIARAFGLPTAAPSMG